MTRSPTRTVVALLVSPSVLWPAVASAQALEPPPRLAPGATTAAPPSAQLPNTPVMPPDPKEDEDSGLGLEWVWLNAEVGGAYVNMQSFSESNLALVKTESAGPAFGVAAGVRLIFLTLGVRVRDLLLSSIGSLWELNAEAALHTRVWRIDPYFGVRGGYNFVGSLSSDSVTVASGGAPPSDVSVHGFNVGPMVGIDIYLAKVVSIGADVDAQFLFLQRPKPPLPAASQGQVPAQYQTLYNNSGSSVGFGVTGAAHLGIHF